MCCSLFLNGAGLYCLLFKQIKLTKKDTEADLCGRLNCLRSSMPTNGIAVSGNEFLRDQQVQSVAKCRW